MHTVQESKLTCGAISGPLRDVGSETLCIIVHGFLSNNRNRLFRNYAKHLAEQGIDTRRPNLYDESTRSSIAVRLQDHIDDIQYTIEQFSHEYKNIIYIGHSLGGAIGGMVNNTAILSGMLLRDSVVHPTQIFENMFDRSLYLTSGLVAVKRSRYGLISKNYADNLVGLDDTYLKYISCPYLSICCSHVGFYKFHKQFDECSKNQTTVLIENSGHSFQQRGAEEKLFELSDRFIQETIQS